MTIHSLLEAEAYLATLPPRPKSYGDRLAHVRSVLSTLNDPQDAIPAIHIAGTSGKGSTAYYASSMLVANGYRVGMNVSPHVSVVSERAQINGQPLPKGEYLKHFNVFVEQVNQYHFELTYIEFMDIFAYWLFARLACDYIVIEVGLGGRLDPTNVMTREDKVAVITDIGLDHTEILGDTLAEIATEKAGIILPGNTVVMHQQSDEVMSVIQQTVKTRAATLHTVRPNRLDYVKALPPFQRRNWSLAREAVQLRLSIDDARNLSEESKRSSIFTSIPGRFETVQHEGVTVILDSAHNPQKIHALVTALNEIYHDAFKTFLLSFGKNKQGIVHDSAHYFVPPAEMIIATEFHLDFDESHGAIASKQLLDLIGGANLTQMISVPSYSDAFTASIEHAKKTGSIVVVTGSFYLVSNIKSLLMKVSPKGSKHLAKFI